MSRTRRTGMHILGIPFGLGKPQSETSHIFESTSDFGHKSPWSQFQGHLKFFEGLEGGVTFATCSILDGSQRRGHLQGIVRKCS